MNPSVRVRFAPSPTGLLHIGNARTALFNVLFAKSHGGTFVLRIEDTDMERSTDVSLDRILDDLRWLEIDWDEGPGRPGPYGPYRQSERLSLYRDYADQLLREGKAYKCFCSLERLETLRKEQISKGKMPRYDGRCHRLSDEEIAGMESAGTLPVLRFHVSGGPIIFQDMIHGRMSFDPNGIGDFVIVRSDGVAAYNFACVIDDHSMHISHVIRGDDHLSNTPRQMLLYSALGWKSPSFAHHPLILGPDRSPLSKRHGATAVSQYREEGFLPEALLNYLVLLGWTPPLGKEILSLDGIIEEFSLQAISTNAPVHSRKKLEWLNSVYIRNKDEGELCKLLLPYLEKAAGGQIDPDYLFQIVRVLKGNLVLLSQALEYAGIFFDDKFSFDDEAREVLSDLSRREMLKTALDFLETSQEIGPDAWTSWLTRLERETGGKKRDLYSSLRAAITGKTRGPELARTLPLLGKERIIRRLNMALAIR